MDKQTKNVICIACMWACSIALATLVNTWEEKAIAIMMFVLTISQTILFIKYR
jgi:hypothetical protein